MVKAKTILVLFIATLLILIIFAGCSVGVSYIGQQSSSNVVETSTIQDASNKAETAEIPKPVKLVIASNQTIGTNEPEKAKAFIEAYKKLSGGVDLEIINNSDAITIVITRLAAGEQTDIFIGAAPGLIQKGAFVPIEQSWIDASTNLKYIPSMYWDNFKVGGKYMSVPFRSMMKTALFIRQDWLDKLHLKVPVTIDDFYNVSKAFAQNDPDENGEKDTYGYGGQNEWNTCAYFFYPIQNALCKHTGEEIFDDNKIIYVPFEDDYEAYLGYLQKCYKEGIIEPQIFTNKEENLKNLFLTGKTGILDFYCINTDEIIAKTMTVNPNAKITIMAPPKGPAGSGNYALISNVAMYVLKTTRNPEATVKYFCDVIHSPEGQQMLCYGPEGINWKRENGVPTATVANPSMGLNATLVINQDKFIPIIPFSTNIKTAIKIFDSATKIHTTAPNQPLNPKGEEVLTLFLEYYAKIITGDLDVESGMQEWKAEFNKKGLNQYYIDVNTDTSWRQ